MENLWPDLPAGENASGRGKRSETTSPCQIPFMGLLLSELREKHGKLLGVLGNEHIEKAPEAEGDGGRREE